MICLPQAIPGWTPKDVDRLRRRYRRATWRSRTLPDFIIIGAQKSGTKSLFHYLSQHPQLLPSCHKEVHFFDGGVKAKVDTFNKGQAWYRSHFPFKRWPGLRRMAFEATPLYIFNPLAPRRIHGLVPRVKLIAVLRNPVERAISHYFHEVRKGRETLPVMDALQAEEERLKPVLDAQAYKSGVFIHYSYKTRGRYHEQLNRYLDYFPVRRLLVINSENLFKHPKDTLRHVFEFVGVDTEFPGIDLQPRNVGGNRTGVEPRVYEYLEDYFQPHNEALYGLLGRNYGW